MCGCFDDFNKSGRVIFLDFINVDDILGEGNFDSLLFVLREINLDIDDFR